jgi:hypothetical protein
VDFEVSVWENINNPSFLPVRFSFQSEFDFETFSDVVGSEKLHEPTWFCSYLAEMIFHIQNSVNGTISLSERPRPR